MSHKWFVRLAAAAMIANLIHWSYRIITGAGWSAFFSFAVLVGSAYVLGEMRAGYEWRKLLEESRE